MPDVGTSRILANTVYRGAADVGSKLISIAFFVVLARQLGESGFGVFVFGLTLAAVLTVLAGFGQDRTSRPPVPQRPGPTLLAFRCHQPPYSTSGTDCHR